MPTPIRILLFEEKSSALQPIVTDLQACGYAVTTQYTIAEAAIQLVGENQPDVILLDLQASGEISRMRAVEEINRHTNIPIIYLIPRADPSYLRQLKISDPLDYLTKPIDSQVLQKTIEMALFRRAMNKKLAEREACLRVAQENSKLLEATVSEHNKELSRAVERLENVWAIGDAIANTSSLDECMQAVAKGCVDYLGFDVTLVRLYDEELQVFTQAAVYPLNSRLQKLLEKFGLDLSTLTFPYIPGQNPRLDGFMTGKTYLGNSFTDLVSPPMPAILANAIQRLYHIKTLLALPLAIEQNTVGWIGLGTQRKEISTEEQHALELVARQAAMAIENARNLEDLQYHTTEMENALGELQKIRASLEQRVEERTAEITQQKQFFEALVNNSPIAIVSLDLNNNVVSANPAFITLFGFSREEITGHNLDALVAPKQLHKEATQYTRTVSKGEIIHSITQRSRRDGILLDVEVFGVPVIVSNRQVGVLAIYNDITEQKRAEDAIREARDQAEVLRDTGAILAGTLDFDGVLDHLLEQVQRVVPYDAGNVMLVKGRYARVARTRGYEKYGAETVELVSKHSFNINEVENLYRMVKTRRPVIIRDTANYPGWLNLRGSENIRSWIGAPIIVQDKVIAFFSLDKAEPNFYTPKYAERLVAFVVQAALAFQNAQLYQEKKDFADKLSTLYNAAQEISSTLHLNELLNIVAGRAVSLANAGWSMVLLIDTVAEKVTHAAAAGDASQAIKNWTFQDILEDISGWVIRQKKPVLSDDILSDPRATPEVRRKIRQNYPKAKGVAYAPLIIQQRVMGILTVGNDEDKPEFTQNDLTLVAMLANQASIAIENAQLFEATQQRAQEAEILRRAGAIVAATLQQKEALDRILHQLTHVVPYESASIQLLQESEGKPENLVIVGGVGYPDSESLIGTSFPLEEKDPGVVVIQSGQPLIITDISATSYNFKELSQSRVKSWMGVPLMVHDKVIGLLSLDSTQPGYFNQDSIRPAVSFADQVAVAIENTRLFEEVQKLAMTDSLTGLFTRRHFFTLAESEYERAIRHHLPISMMMLDLDHFKIVNDTYGHIIGDQVLRTVANCCRESLRHMDILGRYGGEEFIIMLPETKRAAAEQIAWRLCQNIATAPTNSSKGSIFITVSLGVASMERNQPQLTLEQLINYADQALYMAKSNGRSQVSTCVKSAD